MLVTEKLSRHPEKGFNILDDAQARTILIEIGIIDKFRRDLNPGGSSEKFCIAVGYSDHPTHWIVGFLHSGSAEESENGFGAIIVPKSQVSAAQLEQQLRTSMDTDPNCPIFEVIEPLTDPRQN